MTAKRTILALLLMLVTSFAWADVATWTHKWDTSKSSGGEGFYHITNNTDTIQVATLKGLEWTYKGNTSVTAYTATAGQYFGSAKSPVKHATLTTDKLRGKILSVTIEAKVKEDAQDVNIGVSVNGQNYGDAWKLSSTQASHTFEPAADAAEGGIVITMDQTSETVGIIYFYSMTITYDGEGIVKPEPKDPELSYSLQTVEVESGDNAYANYLTNPYKVSPITYSCSDTELASINSNGDIFTTGKKVGQATVSAIFAGNDDYKADTASYTLVVKEKPVIPAPEFDIKGGTFTEPVTVTITSNDPLCKAIWYSTTLTDVADMGYDDQTIIVAGNTAVVTIDETCTLLAVAVGDNNVGLPAMYTFTMNIPLKADFGAEESAKTYYKMGWDSLDEASTWKYYGVNETSTWTLAEKAPLSGVPSFNTIDPSTVYSLTIYYDQSKQRERAVSPEVEVKDNSKAEFYLCFGGVWLVYADLKFYVNDLTDGTQTQIFSAFDWAQDNAFDGPSWEKFSFDISKYAGHKCTFEFIYEGANGDNMAIDNFLLKQEDTSADAKINIMEGEEVHFKDLSQGHPTSWQWTIDGATPATSTEQNPVVKFEKAGKYTVKLAIAKDNETAETTKEEYVIVNVAAPKAHIGVPELAYYSPYAYAFVATDVPMQYKDLSTGAPTAWNWKFEGTDIASSTEQNPTVTYTEQGMYGLELNVENYAGSSRDFLVKAIQAGGTQEVWNIASDEIESIGTIALGWYGYYGGTNWLGMEAFAEKYHAPMAKATVSGATVYFSAAKADDADAEFTVSLCLPDANGMPGEAVATATKKVSDLQVSDTDILPTEFQFETPVEVEGEFFVVAKGFPNTGNNDNVVILAVARADGGRNSAYHLLADEDENYNYTGTYTWYESEDQPVSLCIAPVLSYDSSVTAVNDLHVEKSNVIGIYDIMGRKLNNVERGINIVNGKKVLVK